MPEKVVKSRRPYRKKKDRTEYYIAPQDFKEAIIKYYSDGKFTSTLGEMIKKIAYNMSFSPNFINYTYKDEMISDAIEKMSRAVIRKNFNVASDSSPFSYFSTICWNSFLNRISKEKQYKQTIDDYKEKMYPELLEDQCEGEVHLKNSRQVNDDE